MPTPSLMKMRWVLVVVCLLLMLAIAGCGNGNDPGEFAKSHSRASGTATPTAAPSSLPVHTISLGDYMASAVIPGPHGLLFYGNPKSQGQLTGLPGGTTLYYFDFATGQSRLLAQATPAPSAPSSGRSITEVGTSGDWVVFLIGETGFGDYRELWAVNVVTGARQLMDSYQVEAGKVIGIGQFAVDGQMLVWYSNTKSANLGHWYTATIGVPSSTRAVAAPSGFAGDPFVEDQATLVILGSYQVPDSTAVDGVAVKDEGYYLWTFPDGKPQYLLPAFAGHSFALNSQYLIWDSSPVQTLTLYDRATGQRTENWVKSCIRPALAPDRPYAVCLDYSRDQLMLVQVPSGKEQPLGVSNDFASGEIADGRAYWVQPARGSAFGDTVAYVDLPTR